MAKLIDESRHAKAWGVEFGEPKIDLAKLREFKNNVVKRLTSGTGQLVKHRARSSYLQGLAEIVDAHNLRVKSADGGEEHADASSTRSSRPARRPAIPPALKVDDPRVMDSTGALDLPDIPKSLLVVGGGYIGLELGIGVRRARQRRHGRRDDGRTAARRRSRSRRRPRQAPRRRR